MQVEPPIDVYLSESWNTTETRRDPKTGRRRQFPKPEAEWLVHEDETLQIVPQALWERVQERLKALHKTWPGGKRQRGFQGQQGGRVSHYPTHLLSGAMVCGVCSAAVAQVSGKSGGYYGCLAASKGACENRMLVRRTVAERIIVAAVRDRLTFSENLQYLFKRVEEEVGKLYADLPETIRLKQTEFEAEERRVNNFIAFIAEGRSSRAVTEALAASERKVEELRTEVEGLLKSRNAVFKTPPMAWIEERVATLQEVLAKRTERSALLLRKLLGTIRLEPTRGDIVRLYYRARSRFQVLALLKEDPKKGPRKVGRIICESGGGGNRTRVRKPSATAATCLSGEKVSRQPNLPSRARKALAQFEFRLVAPPGVGAIG